MEAERPRIEAVIAAVEKVKEPGWAEFGDRDGDSGRDRALSLGRRRSGLKRAEWAEAAGLRNDGVVATSAKRHEPRLEADRAERAPMKQVLQLLKCEM